MNIRSFKVSRSEVSRSEVSRSEVSRSEVSRSEVSRSEVSRPAVSRSEVSRHPATMFTCFLERPNPKAHVLHNIPLTDILRPAFRKLPLPFFSRAEMDKFVALTGKSLGCASEKSVPTGLKKATTFIIKG